jgi:hypothetical protein
MYEIRPESIKGFIEDSNIKLPRFQRKQTWDDKKNFQLCISIFKEYPIGVSILNIEKSNGITTRWLLDGRQRRNALASFYRDPENIYVWAKKFIGFKPNDQLLDLEEKFWSKINDYLEDSELDNESEDETTIINAEDDIIEPTSVEDPDLKYDPGKTGLDLLLHIIKLIHNKTNKHSGFTRPFDFTKDVPNLPYTINNNGVKTLNSQKVKTFINEFKGYCVNEGLQFSERKSFSTFMNYRFPLDEAKSKKLETAITQNWPNIIERIDILEKINNLYVNSKIGLIEVKNLKSVDAQKIFNIINSEGTQLTAIEILSAKPSWNIPITNPNSLQLSRTKKLYEKINVVESNVVKWDLPATFMSRLDQNEILFKAFSNEKSDFEKELTLGFKLLAGIFENGVKKENIDSLGKNPKIDWSLDYEIIINEINLISKLILNTEYFKFLKSWKVSIMTLLSDSIALDFLLVLYNDWKRKEKPVGDFKAKQFQKNCFILFDSLVFEYVTKQWRGSADSKIARDIVDLSKHADLLKPIEERKWISLLNEIMDQNSVDGSPITQKLVEPILYHFYALSKIQGPDSNFAIEVDHIIPQSSFKSSALPNAELILHNLYNLALLPKDDNISKSNKRLVEINNRWLITQINKYEFIEESDFIKYSDITNIDELKKLRGGIIMNAFTVFRTQILNN